MDEEINLDSFEKSILSDIKGIKPKSKQRGYAKELIKRLSPGIELALTRGCSYEEIATTISKKKVKISPTTLKRYYLANKAEKSEGSISEVSSTKEKVDLKSSPINSTKKSNSHVLHEKVSSLKVDSVSVLTADIEEDKPEQRTPHLAGASLTDDDYMDDFNDY